MEDVWTVRRILEWIEGYLAQHGDTQPRVSAQWLVSEALGVSRMQLFVDSERPLSEDERAVLRDWTRRRGTGEPLQYITGEVAFRHITLRVRPGVLIPRPETEVLVSEALAALPRPPKPQDEFDQDVIRQYVELGGEVEGAQEGEASSAQLLVADLCTGSGCIACSIAYEHPHARVIATDISPDAVSLAGENVGNLGLGDRVEVLECDLASGIDDALVGSFDLVVSNPPYVPTAVLADIPHEVADYEPALALDGGDDGLDTFRRIATWANGALKAGGVLAVELHETHLKAAEAVAREAGFADTAIVNDLAGRPRILIANTR